MNHSDRLAAFVALGHRIHTLSPDEVTELAARARGQNNWFDEPNVRAALTGVANMLEADQLTLWAGRYPAEPPISRRVGVVMAGNDLLCVLISGHQLLAKPSADDRLLMRWVADELIQIEPRFAERLSFVERLNEADAFIATGSNNTARYFEYYFSKKPHLIRRNRTSLAILNGQESPEALAALGRDIFQYYGLGCRNVSKLYVPEGYSFTPLLDALEPWHTVLHHNRYQNNYDYNKSILLVNAVPHFDNGFLLLNEATALVSPISVLHYGTYTSEVDLADQLTDAAEQIQCIVSDGHQYAGSFAFGQAQSPTVSDYADGVDTMAFLAELV
jgi:hypothetical protein